MRTSETAKPLIIQLDGKLLSVLALLVSLVHAGCVGYAAQPASQADPPPAALQFSISSLPNAQATVAYSATASVTGGTSPYAWSITSGSLPAGLTLGASTGAISGTPISTGTTSFSVQVADSASHTATESLSITVNAAPVSLTITTTSLGQDTVGTSYSGTSLQATGGTLPYTWSLQSGSLPTGLSLTPSTGAISGIPAAAGTFVFIARVTDSASHTATQSLNIVISPAIPPLTVTTSALTQGVVNATYSQTLQASGGTAPYSWSIISGSLPAGLALSSSSGLISGTPTPSGTFPLTFQVVDSGSLTASKSFSLVIAATAPPLGINTTSLAGGTTGVAYSQTLGATGGVTPYSWSVISGSLPPGLSLTASTGVISGTPTQAGTFTPTFDVTDSASNSSTKAIGITISSGAPALSITTTSLPQASTGVAYSQSIQISGGVAPYSWSLASGSLPPGLSLGTGSGSISGTPTQAGTFSFALLVTDSASSTASKSFSLTIQPAPPPLSILTALLPDATTGTSYAFDLTSSGGLAPVTWTITAGQLPAGLTLSPTGDISGIPSASGTFSMTIGASDSSSPPEGATANLNITVAASNLSVSVPNFIPATAGSVWTDGNGAGVWSVGGGVLNISGGTPPYVCSITSGSIPLGMTLTEVTPLSSSTGLCVLTGIPTTAGDYPFTVQASDSASHSASGNVAFFVMSTTLPTLSSIVATNVSSTSEQITWTTNVPSDSQVLYNFNSDEYGLASPEQDSGGVTTHSVTLTNLTPGQIYTFLPISKGISGGIPKDYLSQVDFLDNVKQFTMPAPPTTGTPDFFAYMLGPGNVVQGYPIYLGLYTQMTAGTSAFTNNTLKMVVSGLPPNSTAYWPDAQEYGGSGGCSAATTTNPDDTQTCYAQPLSTSFELLTSQGGVTPTGNYTVTMTVSQGSSSGTITHSVSWPVSVITASFPSGSPSGQPPIPGLATWTTAMIASHPTGSPGQGYWYACEDRVGNPCSNFSPYGGGDQLAVYYDGAWIYDQIGIFTGNSSYWGVGAANSRAQYHTWGAANSWQWQGYWVFPHDLYFNCIVNNSAQSCADLHGLALGADGGNLVNGGHILAGSIRDTCYALGAKRLDYDAGGGTTLAQVKEQLAHCLGTADQFINVPTAGNPYAGSSEQPFQEALFAQAVIEYYLDPNTGNLNDSRIPMYVKEMADHDWATAWVPGNGADGYFIYNLGTYPYGGWNMKESEIAALGPTPYLNTLSAPLYAWLYKSTGQQQYQLEGDAIFYSGISADPGGGIDWAGKNFSQQYRWSFDFVMWRGGTSLCFLLPASSCSH